MRDGPVDRKIQGDGGTDPAGRFDSSYAVLTLLWQNIRLYPGIPETDPVTIHEARIAQLRPLLPPSGAAGYVTTVENGEIFAAEKTFTNVEFLAQCVLTPYTLAPRIVLNSPSLPLVVGNFIDGPAAPGFLEKNGLTPLRDLGDGPILEIPVSCYGRRYSEGKKITWVHGVFALWTLIKYRFTD